MAMPGNKADREFEKFVETAAGETAVRTQIANDSSTPVPISGDFRFAAPTGPFNITVVTATDIATNPLVAPITQRVALSIRNRDLLNTVYFGKSALVTADDTATGGWEVGPNEDFHIDLDDSNNFFLITPAGQTAKVKILEISSIGAVSGGGTLTRFQEQAAGAYDGVNVTFTLSNAPFSDVYLQLYRNGVFLDLNTDYSISGSIITMAVAPTTNQRLQAVYDF
jgi:hypothetical protein